MDGEAFALFNFPFFFQNGILKIYKYAVELDLFFFILLGYSHFFFCFLSPPARIFQGGKKKKKWAKKKKCTGFPPRWTGVGPCPPHYFFQKNPDFHRVRGGYMVTPEKNGVWRL